MIEPSGSLNTSLTMEATKLLEDRNTAKDGVLDLGLLIDLMSYPEFDPRTPRGRSRRADGRCSIKLAHTWLRLHHQDSGNDPQINQRITHVGSVRYHPVAHNRSQHQFPTRIDQTIERNSATTGSFHLGPTPARTQSECRIPAACAPEDDRSIRYDLRSPALSF